MKAKAPRKRHDIPATQSKAIRSLTAALAPHGFDQADVEANRAGQLSDVQIHNLSRDRVRAAVLTYFIGLMVALLVMGMVLIGIAKLNDGLVAIMIIGMIAVACFAVASSVVRSFWQKMNAVIQDWQVESVTGPIDLLIEEKSTNRGMFLLYAVKVAGQTFKISKDTLLQFKNGERYTVYFTPHLRMFLSAEPADGAQVYAEKAKHGGKIELGDDGELLSASEG